MSSELGSNVLHLHTYNKYYTDDKLIMMYKWIRERNTFYLTDLTNHGEYLWLNELV